MIPLVPVLRVLLAAMVLIAGLSAAQKSSSQSVADRTADNWVRSTMAAMSLDEKVGQLLVSSFQSNFISTESTTFDDLAKAVRDYHVGGFHVFGASELAPGVLLNPTYGTVILGQ